MKTCIELIRYSTWLYFEYKEQNSCKAGVPYGYKFLQEYSTCFIKSHNDGGIFGKGGKVFVVVVHKGKKHVKPIP